MGEATFGKYRLIAELGHGGMADVFLAVIAGPVGSGFTKLTVIKRLRQNLADEPEFIEMLVDEARISARLNHPNVVQTNEVGSVGNQYFLAMEYLDGQPLHRIQHRAMQKAQRASAELATNPPAASPSTPPSSVVLPTDPFPRDCQYLVLVDTLAGLHHAHELADYDGSSLGIVHRDVTPHNVFVTYEGQVKVVDFGIAKAAGRSSETRQGVVKGKVRYMAPEQAIGQPVDRRADLFSVGIMLWEAATGRRMWKDMDDLNIVQALVGGGLKASPREIDPNVPEEIDRICKKALAYNVEDRYATADEFRGDLEQYLAEDGKLTSARRMLAAVVCDLFKDKRAEIKGVIEKQLAELKARTSDSMLQPIPIPVDSSSSGSLSMPARSSGPVTVPVAGPDGVTSMTEASTELFTGTQRSKAAAARRRNRLPMLAMGGAVLAACAVIVVNRLGSTNANADAKATTASSVGTTAADIHLKIVTTPQAAQVTIDRAPVTTPSDVKMPRDMRDHTVRVEAPGFDPMVETVRFESDVSMNVVLTKAAPVASASGHAAAVAAATQGARWTPAPPPPPTAIKAATKGGDPSTGTPTPPPPSLTAAPAPAAPSHKVLKPDIDNGDPWAKH